jgi:uncharacterized protein with NRDE domain
MCTVTYIPTPEGCIITSNRDEKITRERALSPQEYLIDGKKIIFPKDPKAGGTWVAHNETKIIVLLNGAQEKHFPKPNYRKSRGLIVLDLMTAEKTLDCWKTIDLTDIEPFTIVLVENNKLTQLQWNEAEKSTTEFDAKQFHIWSSSTLYSKEIREQRKEWFQDFIKSKNAPTPEEILHFHQFTESENKEFGLQINRNDVLKTISITQCKVTSNTIKMEYLELFE